MSVTIRPYRGGGWEVDIRVVSPDGTRHKRERKHALREARATAAVAPGESYVADVERAEVGEMPEVLEPYGVSQ